MGLGSGLSVFGFGILGFGFWVLGFGLRCCSMRAEMSIVFFFFSFFPPALSNFTYLLSSF